MTQHYCALYHVTVEVLSCHNLDGILLHKFKLNVHMCLYARCMVPRKDFLRHHMDGVHVSNTGLMVIILYVILFAIKQW